MKLFVLAALIVLALGQSTNPPGASYFSPSTTKTLYLGQTVSSVLYNSTVPGGYQDHYQIFVPSWVGAVRYTLNNTSPSTAGNYIEAYVNFADAPNDNTVGYSCRYSNYYDAVCSSYDEYFWAYTGDVQVEEFFAGNDFLPGTWQYITVYKYYYSDPNLNTYTLTVEATASCSESSVVGVDVASSPSCIPNSEINHAYSGASYSTYVSPNSNKYYQVDVPKNTSRVYALVSSDVSSLYIFAAPYFVPTSYYYAWDYTYYGYYNSTTNLYNYYLEVPLPNYDTSFYFTVNNYNSYGASVSIQFFTDACGAYYAGYGYISVDYYSGSVNFIIPDCSHSVVAPNINVASFDTISFNLPAYNPSPDVYYAAAYGFMHVPNGTVGYKNFTCSSTVDNSFVAFSKGRPVDCNEYSWVIGCYGPTSSSYGTLSLLSEDLYPGGDWSIAACSSQGVSSTVYLQSSGQVSTAGPSPSPTPSSSPSASPSSSPSSLPSSAPSQSPIPSPDSDSSSDGPQPSPGVYVLLIVVGFLLGVIVGLILGFYLFNKVKARKEAAMGYVPLQPYPMQPGMVPVQMPMYPAMN